MRLRVSLPSLGVESMNVSATIECLGGCRRRPPQAVPRLDFTEARACGPGNKSGPSFSTDIE